jgi:MoaA/NifB/PqqE/SkfB family radical SAM enzyme
MVERPSVEYNLTEHCNLSCTACARGSPMLERSLTALDTFTSDLRALARGLHCTEVRIGGGEPLLHPQLIEFLRAARASGIADRVVLLTNGVLLHQAPTELWQLIDGMWLSLYPGVKIRIPIEECERLARAHGVELKVCRGDNFAHILLNQRNDDDEAVELIYGACKAAREWSCHTVHQGRFYKCSTAPFTGERLARLGQGFAEDPRDFVALDDPALPEAIARYLADERSLAACRYCLGSSGPQVPNRQLNKQALLASMAEDHRITAALVGRALRSERELALSREQLQRKDAELLDLRSSWSWRSTAPLRRVLRALRGR